MRYVLIVTTVALLGSPAFAAPPQRPPITVDVSPQVQVTAGSHVSANIRAGSLTLADSLTVKGSFVVGASLSVSTPGGFTTP
jgi:hypothetical protein